MVDIPGIWALAMWKFSAFSRKKFYWWKLIPMAYFGEKCKKIEKKISRPFSGFYRERNIFFPFPGKKSVGNITTLFFTNHHKSSWFFGLLQSLFDCTTKKAKKQKKNIVSSGNLVNFNLCLDFLKRNKVSQLFS